MAVLFPYVFARDFCYEKTRSHLLSSFLSLNFRSVVFAPAHTQMKNQGDPRLRSGRSVGALRGYNLDMGGQLQSTVGSLAFSVYEEPNQTSESQGSRLKVLALFKSTDTPYSAPGGSTTRESACGAAYLTSTAAFSLQLVPFIWCVTLQPRIIQLPVAIFERRIEQRIYRS